ncbi:MAG: GspE/PulE family protein [Dehalococcoidia bacterium]|jgi:type II secretory ATPase GspE/PulE/Tfp pilus assembly ATPase PilB-like protein
MAEKNAPKTEGTPKKENVVSFQFSSPTVDLEMVDISPDVLALIPKKVALEQEVLPYKIEDDVLTVITYNPDDLQLIDALSVLTKMRIKTVTPNTGDLHIFIQSKYEDASVQDAAALSTESLMDIIAPIEITKQLDLSEASIEEASDAPIVKAVDFIINRAVKERASDIHIAPEEHVLNVRYRIDGVLHNSVSLPLGVMSAVLTRIKILANMNIAERRRPQDGSFSAKIAGRVIDFRVATIGTNWGEYCVMRVLDKTYSLIELSEIGMPQYFLEPYLQCLNSPFGMIVISGPTGSGKTTSLYSSLGKLDREALNIMSIEDPIEYKFEGIRQIQVNRAAEITFAKGLRQCMRLDPDVILVGEIRDKETAQTAVDAALTGHLVLTSIHSNDAVGALVRLVDLGVEPFLVTSAVLATISQRLVRRSCPKCKETQTAPVADQLAYKQVTGKEKADFIYGKGCSHCSNTGFRGRIGVFELLLVTDTIKSILSRGAGAVELKQQAVKDGMLFMRHHGMSLAREGVTTPGEVARHVFTID